MDKCESIYNCLKKNSIELSKEYNALDEDAKISLEKAVDEYHKDIKDQNKILRKEKQYEKLPDEMKKVMTLEQFIQGKKTTTSKPKIIIEKPVEKTTVKKKKMKNVEVIQLVN